VSVLNDVYKLPPEKVLKFFTRDEQNWRDYLCRSDAFTPVAFAELQRSQRATLNKLLNEP